MKQFAQIVLLAAALCAGCSKNPPHSPAEFTKAYVDAMHAAAPNVEIRVNKDLDLTVKSPGGGEFQCYLDNA